MATTQIKFSDSVQLVFGLDWLQRDPDHLHKSEHSLVVELKEKGYTHAVKYKHEGGDMYGAMQRAETDKTVLFSGAALVQHFLANYEATKNDKVVLFIFSYYNTAVQRDQVILVGINAGRVRLDCVVEPGQVIARQQEFIELYCQGFKREDVRTVGYWPAQPVKVELLLKDILGSKPSRQAIVSPLRSNRGLVMTLIVGGGLALLGLAYLGYDSWATYRQQTEALQKAAAEAPATKYQRSITVKLMQPVLLAHEALRAVYDAVKPLPPMLAGWTLQTITCDARPNVGNGVCHMDWSRLYGTVSDFTEAAGADWPTWTNVQYDSPGALSAEFAFKVPAHVLEPDKFLPAKTARTLVYDRWQRLSSIGWKAELKPLAQQALPSDLAPDKLSEIVSYPGGLWALPLSVTDQSLVFLLDSPGSPTATDALPWVELTTPVVVKSSGPSFTFSFGGVMYVKK